MYTISLLIQTNLINNKQPHEKTHIRIILNSMLPGVIVHPTEYALIPSDKGLSCRRMTQNYFDTAIFSIFSIVSEKCFVGVFPLSAANIAVNFLPLIWSYGIVLAFVITYSEIVCRGWKNTLLLPHKSVILNNLPLHIRWDCSIVVDCDTNGLWHDECAAPPSR